MRIPVALSLLAFGLLYSIPTAQAVELWRIGSLDADYGEFALAGRHQDFASTFSQGVAFTIGTSDPARDWPYIHPGPADAWSGNQSHSFKVLFTLIVCRKQPAA